MKYTQYQIDWHSIHPRFKWVAIDSNGRKYAYSRKPTVFNDHYKFENPTFYDEVIFIEQVEPPTENTQCLYERPTMDEKEKAGLTRLYNHLQKMEKKSLKKQLQTIEKNNGKNDL
jgi:hypothetical protein